MKQDEGESWGISAAAIGKCVKEVCISPKTRQGNPGLHGCFFLSNISVETHAGSPLETTVAQATSRAL